MQTADTERAIALLETVQLELARLHNLQAYRAEFDDDNELIGDLLDLRREHDAVCTAIALLQPQVPSWRDVLDDPNAPNTHLSFAAASPDRARPPGAQAAFAPAAE